MAATNTRTYGSVQWALLPGATVRGGVLGIVYLPYTLFVLVILGGIATETGMTPLVRDLYFLLGPVGIGIVGFSVPVIATVLLAYLSYARRRYELGEDGITVTRGVLLRSEQFLDYDDVGNVTHTQSWAQSLYNAGTIRISDVGAGDREQIEFRYVANPEAVYTNVLRKIADVQGSIASEMEMPDIGEVPSESEEVSGLSGDRLAAGTGFRYLMPQAILRPDPWEATKYGFIRSVYHSVVGGGLQYFAGGVLVGLLSIPTRTFFNGVIVLGAVAYAGVLGSWYYWYHDRIQYELYEDHLRVIKGTETLTAAFEDVATVDVREGAVDNDVDNIALVGKNGDELLELRYMTSPDEVTEALEKWVEAARAAAQQRAERSDAGTDTDVETDTATDVDDDSGWFDPTGTGLLR